MLDPKGAMVTKEEDGPPISPDTRRFNATSDGTPEELKACINRGCPWDQPIPARLCRPFGQPFSPTIPIPINLAAQYQRHNLAVLVMQALETGGQVDLLESPI